MRRFLTLVITPIIGIVIVALHLPFVETWLAGKNPKIDIYIIVGFVVLIIINHILTIVSPLKRFERLNKQKWYILSVLIDLVKERYEEFGINFNLMIPKRKWFCSIEPKDPLREEKGRKLKLICYVFDFVWWDKNEPINKQLKITINQGIAGEVFKGGVGIIHNFKGSNKTYNFNKQQIELTQNLKFLDSFPVYKNDKEFDSKQSNKVVAVINAESNLEKSLELFLPRNDVIRNKLTSDLKMLSDICQIII